MLWRLSTFQIYHESGQADGGVKLGGHVNSTDAQFHAQSRLPLTLVPIRIELDIAPFTPPPPFPLPINPLDFGVDSNLPAYRTPEQTTPFKLRDEFLWNLHECLMTPEQFAQTLVQDLDLPNNASTTTQIATQIRQQLEEYAGVALHPLFHSTTSVHAPRRASSPVVPIVGDTASEANVTTQANGDRASSRDDERRASAQATASAVPAEPDPNDPDDAYRCIVTLNINRLNQLYTDRFEWSLLHPPGAAEQFAQQTCADMGLAGEWVPAITHAIYEAVLRLKKEACESGGLIGGGGGGGVEVENLAVDGQAAGLRFDTEALGEEWSPKVETLSREEIEKREGDRERQIRRLRRETARFSSLTGLSNSMTMPGSGSGNGNGFTSQYISQPSVGTPAAGGGGGGGGQSDPFDTAEPGGGGGGGGASGTMGPVMMGRGERSKKKRRFRSLSPLRRSTSTSGLIGSRGTPDQSGYGGGAGGLNEWYVFDFTFHGFYYFHPLRRDCLTD